MGDNTKFNFDELNIENLIDELTSSYKLKLVPSEKEDLSFSKSEKSVTSINAESIELGTSSIENLIKNTDSPDNKDGLAILEEKAPVEEVINLNAAAPVEEVINLSAAAPVEEVINLSAAAPVEEVINSSAALDEPLEDEVFSTADEAEVNNAEPLLLVPKEEEAPPTPLKAVDEVADNTQDEVADNTQLHTSISQPTEERSVQTFPSNNIASQSSANLQTVEYLTIAQNKIIELQKNIEGLHEENADIAAAGELWKQRSIQSKQSLETLKNKYDSIASSQKIEQKIFTVTIEKQNKKIESLKKELIEADFLTEEKLSTYKLIASDLENRIEIIEREKLTLLDGKNKFISDLQRQISTLQKINTNDKKKLHQISNLITEKEKTLKNTIKLLRQTLISLEIEDPEEPQLSLAS